TDFGQQRLRHAENPAKLGVPSLLADIVQRSPAGIGDVRRVDVPARQAPQKEAVDRPASELATSGALARSSDIVEDPRDLGCGKIGVEKKPRSVAYQIFDAVAFQSRALACSSPVLPDDCAVHRLAGRAI